MPAALKLEQLTKSYGGVPAVKGISFAIEPGEIFGLLGPNGAGKSTTINLVAGVTRIDAGRVEIFGHDNRSDYRTTRRLTGVMHQEIVADHFFPIDTALRLHAGYYGVADDPLWRRLLVEKLGLGPHLHKSMNRLSGGLKRRFMVAKALIHKPRLLILDEPTAGVDVELRHTLWEFVREINGEGTTVLLTTHYLEEAEEMCGRIAIMHQGEVVALERTSDLLTRLGGARLVLQLAAPLTLLPESLAPFEPRLNDAGTALSLALPADGNAGEVLGLVCGLGLAVTGVETQQTDLEDIFLHLTGSDRSPRQVAP